jgi:hypothetical protein
VAYLQLVGDVVWREERRRATHRDRVLDGDDIR